MQKLILSRFACGVLAAGLISISTGNSPAALPPVAATRVAPKLLGKGLQPAYLRCEYRVNPLGIGETSPRLSWVVESGERGQRQTAYRIIVASSAAQLAEGHGDLWDTGKVVSSETTGIVYAGKPLGSGQQCFWKIKVWDAVRRESLWSESAFWTMGLLQPSDWQAQWIGADQLRQAALAAATNTASATPAPAKSKSSAKSTATGTNVPAANPASTNAPIKNTLPRMPSRATVPPAVYLRTGFTVKQRVACATLYATGLGWFDLHLNGRRVTDDYFNPGWTDYNKRVYYRAYDVTDTVRSGANAFGVILSDGWYSGCIGWKSQRNHYGNHPRVLAQLVLEFADGTRQIVTTGPDWKASLGPVTHADILQGETHDATKEISGWDKAGFNDKSWQGVDLGTDLSPVVQAHPGPPVVAFKEFTAKSITEPKPGRFVFDFGQNFAGVTRLSVRGKAGQKITIRHGERLDPDGTIHTANLRTAAATDEYICKGKGTEVWSPRLTFHGFQYVEVTGLTEKPNDETIVGMALGSETTIAGEFACSDPMLNQLHNNVYWTQRANFIDIPTDCPQRDERLGWTGDAQVYIRTATLNTDVQAFFAKWLVDLEDGQRADGQFPKVAPVKVTDADGGPAWADAGVICPWTIYEVYGDKRVLERHYPSMQKFIEFCGKRSTPELLPPAKYHCYGDWVSIKTETPKEVIYTAYFAYSTRLLARAAEALGKTEDAVKYNALFEKIKAAFNTAYVAADGRIRGDTQCSYVLALAFELVDGEAAKRAAEHLVADIAKHDWRLTTGFVGTKDLMLVLAKIGRNDVAYRLVHNETFPSWGFSIKNGATSIWERWDGWTPEVGFEKSGMNSFAHYSFGAVYGWMAENIGGIRNAGLAYDRILIAPEPGGKLTSARVAYDSIRGTIRSEWKKSAAGFTLNVLIPANTTGIVSLPAASADDITEGGSPLVDARGLKFLKMEGGRAQIAVSSGNFSFAVKPAK